MGEAKRRGSFEQRRREAMGKMNLFNDFLLLSDLQLQTMSAGRAFSVAIATLGVTQLSDERTLNKTATADGLIFSKSENGVAAGSHIRNVLPEMAELLDEWDQSADAFFVYVRDRQGIELAVRSARDLDHLIDEVLPSTVKTDLVAELYCIFHVVAGENDTKAILERINLLHPFEDIDMSDPQKIAIRGRKFSA